MTRTRSAIAATGLVALIWPAVALGVMCAIRYRVAPGKRRSVTLKLSRDGRTAATRRVTLTR